MQNPYRSIWIYDEVYDVRDAEYSLKITGRHRVIVVFLAVGEARAHTVKKHTTSFRTDKNTFVQRNVTAPRLKFLTIADHACSADSSSRRTCFISVRTLVVSGRRQRLETVHLLIRTIVFSLREILVIPSRSTDTIRFVGPLLSDPEPSTPNSK